MKFLKFFSLLMSLSFFLISCQLDIPIKELANAKKEISTASHFKAEKYSSKKLKLAKDSLLKCNVFLKAENMKRAKSEAEKSYKYAHEALTESLPLLSNDLIKKSQGQFQRAISLNGKVYDNKNFVESERLLGDMQKLHNEKSFKKVCQLSFKFNEKINLTIDNSLKMIPILKKQLASLKLKLDELSVLEFSKVAKDKLGEASLLLESTNKSLEEEKLKPIEGNISKIKNLLDVSSKLIGSAKAKADEEKRLALKKSISDKSDAIKKSFENLSKNGGKELIKSDLTLAFNKIETLEKLLDENKLDDALKGISELENLYAIDSEKLSFLLLKKKIGSVEKRYNDLKSKNNQTIEKDLININKLILSSKDFLKQKDFKDCKEKISDAENLINSLIVFLEKDNQKDNSKIGQAIYYTVKYNKKNTDCLWKIAQKVYKNAKLWPHIYIANKKIIKNPDLIFPGQKFLIPSLKTLKKKVFIIKKKRIYYEKNK